MLQGRRLLITGVINRHSIAFATAKRAQELGAEVVLTGFGRTIRMTKRAAQQLPTEAQVLELDVSRPQDIQAVHQRLRDDWGELHGLLHAVAYAPPTALGGRFLQTSLQDASLAFATSAYSLQALVSGLLPLLRAAEGGAGVVALDFDATVAWPSYDWMGVAKAALESISRYLARDLGRHEIRVNLVSAGPVQTLAASGIEGFEELASAWGGTSPLPWDATDATPVADAACFLLSPLARRITGEILHVDGGYHAVGAPLQRPHSAAAEE